MMYKLLNRYFGWDYILWKNTASTGISRVIICPDETLGYWRYRSIKVFDKIEKSSDVIWLTCKPSKYINE